MNLRRSMLFMPGNNPGMLQNAGVLGADSIILDLEDAVSISEKDSARILARNAIKDIDFCDCEIVVRINPLSTAFGEMDMEEIIKVKPDAIMLPKADKESVADADELMYQYEEKWKIEKGSVKIFPLIETSYGLENVYDTIKASNRVLGILLGAEDLTSDMGVVRTKGGDEIFYARCKIASACRALKVDAVDTPFTDINDIESLKKDTQKAKSIGMTGKAAINPRQIDAIHGVFAPTEKEIKYARAIIIAMKNAQKEGKGVFSFNGKMVDAPVIARAQNILKAAGGDEND